MKHNKHIVLRLSLAVSFLMVSASYAAGPMNTIKQIAGQQVPGGGSSSSSTQSVQRANPAGAMQSVAQRGNAASVDGIGRGTDFVPVTANKDEFNPNMVAARKKQAKKAKIDREIPAFQGLQQAAGAGQAPRGGVLSRSSGGGLLSQPEQQPIGAAVGVASLDDDQDEVVVEAAEVRVAKKTTTKNKTKALAKKAKGKPKKRSVSAKQKISGQAYREKLLREARSNARKPAAKKQKSVARRAEAYRGKAKPHIRKKRRQEASSIGDVLKAERAARAKKKPRVVLDDQPVAQSDASTEPKAGGKFATLQEKLKAGKVYKGM